MKTEKQDQEISLNLLIIILSIVVLIILGIVYYLMSGSDNSSNKTFKKSNTSQEKVVKLPEYRGKGYQLFKTNCKGCHDPKLRKKKVGPPLLGVTDRRDSVWIMSFIKNSQKMFKKGDPIAVQLIKEYDNTQMSSFEMVPQEELDSIYVFLKKNTDLAKKK